jgi:predicted AlkP superfamily phosphohydrolase/phosphomutase
VRPGGVIAVCIEVASSDLLEGWLEAGWMPNLQRLRDAGFWCPLDSVSDISSGAIWPSFTTGTGPAGHGQFFTHMQLQSGSYRIVKQYADDIPRDPYWLALHRAGRRSAIIDAAQSRPLPGFNGVHVVGWGGEFPAWPRSSWPPSLMPEILRRFGRHPLAEQFRLALRPDSEAAYQRLHDDLVAGARAKAALSLALFEQGPFDHFLTVFAETHWAMHLLWHLLDEAHPEHDSALAGRHAYAFRDILAVIDDCIGDLRARAPEADLFVFSLSGMGPNYSGWHLLGTVLGRLGVGPAEPRGDGAQSWLPMRRWDAWTVRALKDLASPRLLDTAKRLVPARLWDSWTRRIIHAGSGWPDSRAFWLPNDYIGAIRLNLAGREPQGRVTPGADADALCREIIDALRALVDVDSGRPIVREVIRTRDTFAGAHLDALPDLLVLWASEAPVHGVRSAALGEIRLASPEQRTGAHRPQGFLAAAGPRIVPAGRCQRAHIVDLAPTFLHLAGVAAADDTDDRVIEGLVLAAHGDLAENGTGLEGLAREHGDGLA